MAEAIVSHFQKDFELIQSLESIVLVPMSKGIFDVLKDGNLIYSKYETGRHPTRKEILELLKK